MARALLGVPHPLQPVSQVVRRNLTLRRSIRIALPGITVPHDHPLPHRLGLVVREHCDQVGQAELMGVEP